MSAGDQRVEEAHVVPRAVGIVGAADHRHGRRHEVGHHPVSQQEEIEREQRRTGVAVVERVEEGHVEVGRAARAVTGGVRRRLRRDRPRTAAGCPGGGQPLPAALGERRAGPEAADRVTQAPRASSPAAERPAQGWRAPPSRPRPADRRVPRRPYPRGGRSRRGRPRSPSRGAEPRRQSAWLPGSVATPRGGAVVRTAYHRLGEPRGDLVGVHRGRPTQLWDRPPIASAIMPLVVVSGHAGRLEEPAEHLRAVVVPTALVVGAFDDDSGRWPTARSQVSNAASGSVGNGRNRASRWTGPSATPATRRRGGMAAGVASRVVTERLAQHQLRIGPPS